MKKTYALLTVLVLAIAATGQTLNVKVGNVIYQFPAAQTGDMNYQDGQTLTVMGKTFPLADISAMTIDDTKVTDNLVSVAYNSTTATVTVAGNVAQYVEPTISGAHVTIAQSNTDAVNDDEITYQLSGTTTDGEFALSGSYKCTVSLAGVTLTNPSGAAINITNGKRIQLSAKKNTTNTLTDGANGSQKACLYSKGQIQFQGNGTLNVIGNTKHAIKSGDYISVKNLTLNVTKAAGDGISCNEYFQMKSGTVTISGVADDGIQCDLDGDTSTGETTDHEDEDSGNIYLEGGTLNVTVTAAAAKAVKAAGDIKVSGGDITCKTTGGGAWDSDDKKTKASACLSADGNMTISGGTFSLTSTGAGGKGISVDGTLTTTGGTLTVATSGQAVVASSSGSISTVSDSRSLERYTTNYKSSPKGIKVDGAIAINGGTINVTTTGIGGEGIESKSALNITDGYIYVSAADDAINCSSHMTITGGYIMASSTGNDGLDANGNVYIKGGNIFAVATTQPEVGIDANTEGNYKLYITGGNIVSIGGFESGASISGGTAKSASYSKGTWYALYNGSDIAFAFKVPSNSSMGSSMAVFTSGTPALKSGVTTSGNSFWSGNGNSNASGGNSVSLSTYNSNSGGPGGGGGRPW